MEEEAGEAALTVVGGVEEMMAVAIGGEKSCRGE